MWWKIFIYIQFKFSTKQEKQTTQISNLNPNTINFTSSGGLDELPKEDILAPSLPAVIPSISHSDVVSESLKREVVLGGDK